MPKSIIVSDEIYSQLEKLAIGFDTPERVIARLIDGASSAGGDLLELRPDLTFIPNEAVFKNELLKHKRAQVVLRLTNGDRDVVHWNASRLKGSSNLRANLWSGILRNWKEKGIISAEFSVLSMEGVEQSYAQFLIALANELNWTIDEVENYFIEHELISSDDGHPYYYLATFQENTPAVLKSIGGLNSSNHRHLDLNIVPEKDEGLEG